MEQELTLYTAVGCGKCMILKKILDTKKIQYSVVGDTTQVSEKAQKHGIMELPILTVGEDTVYSGLEAVIYGKGL